jgi:uncharacterized phage-associated protein
MQKASSISDFFIASLHECGDPLSNLKLQKLLYYAQAWHLAIFDAPLFAEDIEAWVHGPVVVSEYRRFKGWAWQPIMDNPAIPTLDDATKAHLQEVLEAYGSKNAYELEQLTHSEAPWKIARKGISEDEPSNEVISYEEMKKFYRLQMNG